MLSSSPFQGTCFGVYLYYAYCQHGSDEDDDGDEWWWWGCGDYHDHDQEGEKM